MKGSNSVHPAEDRRPDERVEQLVDEAVAHVARPDDVDLKARVMAAIEARQQAEGRDRRRIALGWPLGWRPSLVLANAALIVVVVFLAWPHPHPGARTVRTPPTAGHLVARPQPLQLVMAPAASGGEVASAAAPRNLTAPPRARAARDAGAGREDSAGARGVEDVDAGPYMPGAPAGNLGDPLQPLPAPPPITMAPIVTAPPVSDVARPVTDFPGDNPAPDAQPRLTGQSGGRNR